MIFDSGIFDSGIFGGGAGHLWLVGEPSFAALPSPRRRICTFRRRCNCTMLKHANDNPANRLLACHDCDGELFVVFVLDGEIRLECERCAADLTKEFVAHARCK